MGALFGLELIMLLIEINNEEVPILDGSAKEFVEKIFKTGIKSVNAPIKIIKIKKKLNLNMEKDLFN